MYDVEKGSWSDDPSDENKIRHTSRQLYNSLRNARRMINTEFDHIESLIHRVMDLSEGLVSKKNSDDNWPKLRYDDPNMQEPRHEENLKKLKESK